MSANSDLMKLYSTRILALASAIPHVGRLDTPDASAMCRSPLCGSQVTVDVTFDGTISSFAQDVKACALGQAAAAIAGEQMIGRTVAQVQEGRDQLAEMLAGASSVPLAPFDGFEVLQPAVDYKNRHASILLVFDATLAALAKIK